MQGITSSCTLQSAPSFKSSWMTSVWSFCAAKCSAVLLSCKEAHAQSYYVHKYSYLFTSQWNTCDGFWLLYNILLKDKMKDVLMKKYIYNTTPPKEQKLGGKSFWKSFVWSRDGAEKVYKQSGDEKASRTLPPLRNNIGPLSGLLRNAHASLVKFVL